MSEDPAPYWTSELHPYRGRRGWRAAVCWRDAVSGHELQWESAVSYISRDAALQGSEAAARDHALVDRLLAESPRDMEAYWRRRSPWLFARTPLRTIPPRRSFVEWANEMHRRLAEGGPSPPASDPGRHRPV